MNKFFIIIWIVITCLSVPYAYAVKETVNERLIRVEESIKNLDMRLTQRIEDTNKSIYHTNKSIDILRQDIDRRFDEMSKAIDKRFDAYGNRFDAYDRRFDDIISLIYVVLASLFTIITMLCGLIFYIVKKERQKTMPEKNELQATIKKVDLLENDFHQKVMPLLEHFDFRLILQKIDALENDFREKLIPLWKHFKINNQNPKMSYA
jgi:hypothetical protein